MARGQKHACAQSAPTENAKMRCGQTSAATSQSVQSSSFPEMWGSRTGHLPHCGHPAGNNVPLLWSCCPLTHANNPRNLHIAWELTHWQRGQTLLALDTSTTSGIERGSPGSQISKMAGCQKATVGESRSVSLSNACWISNWLGWPFTFYRNSRDALMFRTIIGFGWHSPR